MPPDDLERLAEPEDDFETGGDLVMDITADLVLEIRGLSDTDIEPLEVLDPLEEIVIDDDEVSD